VSDTPQGPFVPLPMHAPPAEGAATPKGSGTREVRVVYVRYHDPNPLEFPNRPERLPGPIFHAAGVLLREDDEFLALGEVAFAEENPPMVQRYGADLFPAYRNVLTIPKATIVERRDQVF
jgi:hypothetical protein